MITPTSYVYEVLALYGVCFFGGAFVVETIALLKEHHWNIIATIKDFLKDF